LIDALKATGDGGASDKYNYNYRFGLNVDEDENDTFDARKTLGDTSLGIYSVKLVNGYYVATASDGTSPGKISHSYFLNASWAKVNYVTPTPTPTPARRRRPGSINPAKPRRPEAIPIIPRRQRLIRPR